MYAAAILIIAVAGVVGVSAYVHSTSSAAIYGSTSLALSDGSAVDPSGPSPVPAAWGAAVGPGALYISNLGREGVSWVRRGNLEAFVWAAVLLAVGLCVLVMRS